MGVQIVIYNDKGFIRTWIHKLFFCPTFWDKTPAFTCPVCGNHFRCYWDGNDVGGKNDICKKCYEKIIKEGKS